MQADDLEHGPGIAPYQNASKQAGDLFYEHPPLHGIRLFTRQFWGSNGASIAAAVAVKNGRPALLSIVPAGLRLPSASMLNPANADQLALVTAQRRSAAMQGGVRYGTN